MMKPANGATAWDLLASSDRPAPVKAADPKPADEPLDWRCEVTVPERIWIVIPTQAGAASLDSTIRAYLDGMRQRDRVIVMSNGDSDGAVPFIKETGQDDPRVRAGLIGVASARAACSLPHSAGTSTQPPPGTLFASSMPTEASHRQTSDGSALEPLRRTHDRIEMARPLAGRRASTSPPTDGEPAVPIASSRTS